MSSMSPPVKIQWVGFRKNSTRGAVCGWFTETDKSASPIIRFSYNNSDPEVKCHMFYGYIGKELYITEENLTHEFLSMVETRKNNYKTVDAEKIISRWGRKFNEDLSMYLLMLKLKG